MKFENIQVGDNVVEESRFAGLGYRNRFDLRKVERVTKTSVILINDKRFRKEDGHQYDNVRWSNTIHLLTDEMLENVRMTQVKIKADELSNTDFRELIESGNGTFIESIYDMVMDRINN